MSQVVDPFAIPSIAAKHAALPANVVQAYSLDDSVAQGAVLTTGVVQRTASAVEVSKDSHPSVLTDDVVQTVKDRAHLLSKTQSFNAPNTFQRILDSVLRIEARLENASIVKRNRMQLVNNSGTTAYIARQKQVAGDGLNLSASLAPVNVPVPAANPNATVGTCYSATIDVHGMDHAMILGMIRFHNEDFGIIVQDTVPMRSQKIANWLTDSMF